MTMLKQGTLLENGKYRIEKVIGQGGFGITYLGEQVGLGRKVAIKEFFMKDLCNRDSGDSRVYTLSKGSAELVERYRAKFIKEARNLAALRHTNIVSVIDVFESNDTAYYVMEYHSGGSLADKVKNGPLAEADAVRYIKQAAAALDYIHARQIMHLDVKPANILLDDEDSAVLIDFGLAKQYDEAGHQTSATPVGISHGYAPMEQYRSGGVETFSPVVDIYSLGATLYKLVTGLTPPEASDIFDSGLPKLPATLSAGVRSAIEKAMQPRRVERPQSVGEFLALLDSAKVATTAATNTAEPVAKVVAPAAAPVVAPAAPAINCETMLNTDADAATSIAATADDAATSFAAPAADAATALASTPEAPAPAAKPAVHPVATPKMSDAERSAAIKKVVEPKKKGCGVFVKTVIALVVLAALAVGGYLVWDFINAAHEENKDEFTWEQKMEIMNKYEEMGEFDENGLAQVRKSIGKNEYGYEDYRYGYIDKNGKEVVPCQYDYVNAFSEGLAKVADGDYKHGFVDVNGNEVIPCQYGYVRNFSDGLAAVEWNGNYGFIDKNGDLAIDTLYHRVSDFRNGHAVVSRNGEVFVINKNGEYVKYITYVPQDENGNYYYCNIYSIADLVKVRISRSVYDSSGNYSHEDIFMDKLIDTYGNTCFEDYDHVYSMDYKFDAVRRKNPMLLAERGEEQAVIDMNGNVVIPFGRYDYIDDDVFYGFTVGKNSYDGNYDRKEGCLNFNGEEVIPCEYDEAFMISEKLAFVRNGEKCGIVNDRNEVVVPIKYKGEDIHPYFGIKVFKVTDGGNTLYYSFDGEQIAPDGKAAGN